MRNEVNINASLISWAIARAGYDLHDFTLKEPNIQQWLDGKKKPTVRQLEDFSRKVYLPYGYLFLPEPPKEKLPIPFFRSDNKPVTRVSINVYDMILLMQQRQDWLRNYLLDHGFGVLPFVGTDQNKIHVAEIVDHIRNVLGVGENWASKFRTWQDALEFLTQQIEDKGIIIVFNGVFENNAYRKIPVEECRGFVLVDPVAPFMFVNNDDYKTAQIFTIMHELAHIWTGHSAGFDFRQMQPADNPVEILCDKIAAEFLVPEKEFNAFWSKNPGIKSAAYYFKVSEIVIARRALDTGKFTKRQFFGFYLEYINREIGKRENHKPGGDFYATTRKRLSVTFAAHINNAVKSGELLYRDAYKLTGLQGDTFQKFFNEHL